MLGVVTGVLLLAAICAVSLWPDGEPDAGDGADQVLQTYDIAERVDIEPFTAALLDGGSLSSAEFVGDVTVVNVWGSWCGPCRLEAPELASAARDLEGRVRFVGINVRDNPDAARAFERSFGIPYPSVHPDESARAILSFGGALTIAAVPSTVVLDRNARVAARVVGQVDGTTLRGLIRDVLQE